MSDLSQLLLDSAPFSFLAVACAITNPVWLAAVVSLFVRNKMFRMSTGIITALAGIFIVAMGATSFAVGTSRASAAARFADPIQAPLLEARGRSQATSSLLLLGSVGMLPLLLGTVATGLGARMPPAPKKS